MTWHNARYGHRQVYQYEKHERVSISIFITCNTVTSLKIQNSVRREEYALELP